MRIERLCILLGFVQVVLGQDCSSLLDSTDKRFLVDTFYNAYNKLPPDVKKVLPGNTEVNPSCRFDLLSLNESQKGTLKGLYDQGYSICVGCGYTDSDYGLCHSIDVCKKGSRCIQAINTYYYPQSYYWHGCCDPNDAKCLTATKTLSFFYGVYLSFPYAKTACQGPLCNENGYTGQKNELINFLLNSSSTTTATATSVNQSTTIAIPVDGGWSPWNDWSSCDKSCDIGIRHRVRACTSPVPVNGGSKCTGNDIDNELCNVNTC